MSAGAALAQGALIGFAIAAPVGPNGLLCIRRTLAEGSAAGAAAGLGIAVAHALFSFVAVQGLAALAVVLDEHSAALRVVGGLMFMTLGGLSLRRAVAGPDPMARPRPARRLGLAGAFGASLGLALSNPMTIVYFSGVVAALAAPDAPGQGLVLVAGVFAGSIAWWLLLVAGVASVRQTLPAHALRWITGMSGAVLVAFGAAAALAWVRP